MKYLVAASGAYSGFPSGLLYRYPVRFYRPLPGANR